jgi:hypothetical protein
MPDTCDHSPFKDDPAIVGLAQSSGHRRYCDLIDPEHPAYDPRIAAQYAVLTYQALGLEPPPEAYPLPGPKLNPLTGHFPPLVSQARSLAAAVVKAVASGGKQVSPEERDRRLAICGECEHFDAARLRCRKCACYMPLKVRVEALHCPLPIPKW